MATAFSSYAHEDQEFVLALADRLAAEELDVEFDQIALRVGDSLIARLADVIATDDFLIAVVSPDSVESDWCRKELALAMTQGIKESRVKVLPVRFREAEMPPALGDTFVADADKFEIESVGHALAAAIKSHRAGADIGAAVAEVEDAFHASAFQGSPVQARRRDELVAQLDGSIVECVFEVLVQWDYLTHGSNQVEGLRNAQRRLRFALDAISDELRDALPLVVRLAEAQWPDDFEPLDAREVEDDLREEIRAARTQLQQGLPLSRRWTLAGAGEQGRAPNRFAMIHAWTIEREGERRSVYVYITDDVMAATRDLPREVAEARATNGRAAARTVLSVDDPPPEILVATYGIRWTLPE